MLRTLWTLLAAVLTVVVTGAVFLAVTWPWATDPGGAAYARGIVAILAGLAFFLVATFLLYALADAIGHAWTNRRLRHMTPDDPTGPNHLISAFRTVALRERAERYVGTLAPSNGRDDRPYITSDPAMLHFDRASLVDRPLHWNFFRAYPRVLAILGGLGLLLALAAGLRSMRDAGDLGPLATALESGVVLLTAGFVAALLASAVLNVVRGARLRQLEMTWSRVDALYLRADEDASAGRLADLFETEFANTRMLLRNQHEELRDLLRRDGAAADAESSKRIEAALANLPAALAPALDRMAKSVEAMQAGNADAAARLIDGALVGFREELHSTYLRQADDANRLLATTQTLATELHARFEAAAAAFDHVAAQGPATIEALRDLVERLGASVEALQAQLARAAELLSSVGSTGAVGTAVPATGDRQVAPLRADPSVTSALKELSDELDRISQALPELRPAQNRPGG